MDVPFFLSKAESVLTSDDDVVFISGWLFEINFETAVTSSYIFLVKYSRPTINNILHCSTEIYPLGPLYQHIMVLYSNICIREVIAEKGTRVPLSIPTRFLNTRKSDHY